MNYTVYKEARAAAWRFLIENSVTELPVSFSSICQQSGIRIYRDTACVYLMPQEHGATFLNGGCFNVLVSGSDSLEEQRFTIAHELGHIFMRHPMNGSSLGRTFGICHHPVSPEEYQAERFAMDILAPACVLWALDVRSPEDIARLCRVSPNVAAYRAGRLRELRKRNKFLTDPLELQVLEQFAPFINRVLKKRR
ncbi:MAG: ImmA/IrrE family metallo-endopeptidase [Ruminococcus sp.]|nr:ImmA/IrrE family metallo-endopeptidase [Ruminococcus sp.]MBQ3855125.1 ImmA/IrrE family metallo-endopeptidase [Ruminococcus sp.]MBQ8121752.1 ImmA/IrrE family metallo-endopeptidase [Ruminococcus sp.]